MDLCKPEIYEGGAADNSLVGKAIVYRHYYCLLFWALERTDIPLYFSCAYVGGQMCIMTKELIHWGSLFSTNNPLL